MTIEATKAEIEHKILERSQFEAATRQQVESFMEYVHKAVSLVCHAAPEYIIPCQIYQNAISLGADMVGSMSEDGELIFQEIIRGGDDTKGNA